MRVTKRLQHLLPVFAALLLAQSLCRADNSSATRPSTRPTESESSWDYDGPPLQSEKISGRLANAGSRGADSSTLSIYVWCPDEPGATVREKPTLVWYLNEATPHKMTVTISDEEKHKSVRVWSSSKDVPAGIHILDLSGKDFSLAQKSTYKWTVRVIYDETDPSKDLFSCGYISRISNDPAAARHTFYDSIGSAVNALDNAKRASDTATSDSATAAIKQLLQKVKMPPDAVPDNFVITRDSSEP